MVCSVILDITAIFLFIVPLWFFNILFYDQSKFKVLLSTYLNPSEGGVHRGLIRCLFILIVFLLIRNRFTRFNISIRDDNIIVLTLIKTFYINIFFNLLFIIHYIKNPQINILCLVMLFLIFTYNIFTIFINDVILLLYISINITLDLLCIYVNIISYFTYIFYFTIILDVIIIIILFVIYNGEIIHYSIDLFEKTLVISLR